jgi:hypothetical protein
LGGIVTSEKETSSSMNVNQASERLTDLLGETFSGIKPGLKWRDGETSSTQLADSISNKNDGTATISRTRYVRTKVTKGKIGSLAGAVERGWKDSGYKITGVNPKEPSFVGIAPDGFSIRFSVGAPGNVYFDVSSPAIKDPGYSGTVPGEEGDDFPKNAKGLPDIMPDLDDSYWSH